jgi:hypothetical protein
MANVIPHPFEGSHEYCDRCHLPASNQRHNYLFTDDVTAALDEIDAAGVLDVRSMRSALAALAPHIAERTLRAHAKELREAYPDRPDSVWIAEWLDARADALRPLRQTHRKETDGVS